MFVAECTLTEEVGVVVICIWEYPPQIFPRLLTIMTVLTEVFFVFSWCIQVNAKVEPSDGTRICPTRFLTSSHLIQCYKFHVVYSDAVSLNILRINQSVGQSHDMYRLLCAR